MSPRLTDEQVRALQQNATPGPWRRGTTRTYAIFSEHHPEPMYAALATVPHLSADLIPLDAIDVENARLIAAAPDLAADLLEARSATYHAFVQGAKWWEWHKTGGTMFQSDQRLAEFAAEERYPYAPHQLVAAMQAERDEARAQLEALTGQVQRVEMVAAALEEHGFQSEAAGFIRRALLPKSDPLSLAAALEVGRPPTAADVPKGPHWTWPWRTREVDGVTYVCREFIERVAEERGVRLSLNMSRNMRVCWLNVMPASQPPEEWVYVALEDVRRILAQERAAWQAVEGDALSVSARTVTDEELEAVSEEIHEEYGGVFQRIRDELGD